MARKRTYTLNENAFSKIDTANAAYWLGFLIADGYVKTVPQHLCSLKLNEKDKFHLEKFQTFLETNKPLFYRECKTPYGLAKSYQLDICGKKIVEDLISKGCVNKKSLITVFPTNQMVPNEFMADFIRGYFDGDGSIFLHKTGKVGINVCGTYEFLSELSLLIFGEVVCIYKEKRRSTNTWNWKFGGKRAKKFLEYIYNNSEIALDRKFEIYKNLK